MAQSFVAKMRFLNQIPLANRFTSFAFSKFQLLYYGKVVTKQINGITYELDLSEDIDSSLYFFGYYEKDTSKLLHQYIKPDMTIVEVGANIGAHTFEIAKMLDPDKGVLFSFEPTDYAFRKLMVNLLLNNFQNIYLEKMALSDTNEEKKIHRATSPESMPFKASWDKKKHGPKYRSVDVIKFKKLDDYYLEHKLTKLDLIKIDVDGYELRVIKGGKKTLTKFKPIMIIELGITVERIGDTLEELIQTLVDIGYSFYSIDLDLILDYAELIEHVKAKRTMDCLCLPT